MSDYEEFDVYGEWDLEDGFSNNTEIGTVDLDPGDLPDRIEINGVYYIAEK